MRRHIGTLLEVGKFVGVFIAGFIIQQWKWGYLSWEWAALALGLLCAFYYFAWNFETRDRGKGTNLSKSTPPTKHL
jgi:predicted MFS family arabinose efflux permease